MATLTPIILNFFAIVGNSLEKIGLFAPKARPRGAKKQNHGGEVPLKIQNGGGWVGSRSSQEIQSGGEGPALGGPQQKGLRRSGSNPNPLVTPRGGGISRIGGGRSTRGGRGHPGPRVGGTYDLTSLNLGTLPPPFLNFQAWTWTHHFEFSRGPPPMILFFCPTGARLRREQSAFSDFF